MSPIEVMAKFNPDLAALSRADYGAERDTGNDPCAWAAHVDWYNTCCSNIPALVEQLEQAGCFQAAQHAQQHLDNGDCLDPCQAGPFGPGNT